MERVPYSEHFILGGIAMKKKMVSMLLVSVMLGTLLTGCGKEGQKTVKNKEGEVKLTFGIHVADPKSQEAVTYNIVQAFNEKYEGQYEVEFQAADTESHSKNIKLQASDNTLPEMFWLDASEAPEYAEAGCLMDLTEFLQNYKEVDEVLDASVKAAFKTDIQYGLPYQCNVEGFFYNKEVFEKLGVDVPKNGTTFEELLTLIDACNQQNITPVAQGCLNSSYTVWGYLAMLERYGYSEYIQNILDGKEKFNNENLIKCFEKLQQLGENKAFVENMATQEYFDAKELFISGKAALFNTGAWDCAELNEKMGDKVGFWWGPTFSDSDYEQKIAMKVPSAPICISAEVEGNEEVKEGIYKFLEFYYSKDAAGISYQGSVFPATNYTEVDVKDDQYLLKEVLKSVNEGWESPDVQPDLRLNSAVQGQLYDSMFGVLLGNYEPAEALDKIDQQLDY